MSTGRQTEQKTTLTPAVSYAILGYFRANLGYFRREILVILPPSTQYYCHRHPTPAIIVGHGQEIGFFYLHFFHKLNNL